MQGSIYFGRNKEIPSSFVSFINLRQAEMAQNVTAQVDRTLEQLMEQEQFEIGWNVQFEAA